MIKKDKNPIKSQLKQVANYINTEHDYATKPIKYLTKKKKKINKNLQLIRCVHGNVGRNWGRFKVASEQETNETNVEAKTLLEIARLHSANKLKSFPKKT